MVQKLLEVADLFDREGLEREADIITAIINKIVGSNDCSNGNDVNTEKAKEEPGNLMQEAVDSLVDNSNIKDLKDLKYFLTGLKNSNKFSELIEDDWEKVYKEVLDKLFQREYTEREQNELEEELQDLEEDRKRKGELTREEELDYEMIKSVLVRESHEEIRPSDKD